MDNSDNSRINIIDLYRIEAEKYRKVIVYLLEDIYHFPEKYTPESVEKFLQSLEEFSAHMKKLKEKD